MNIKKIFIASVVALSVIFSSIPSFASVSYTSRADEIINTSVVLCAKKPYYYKNGEKFIYDPEVKDGDHYLGGDDFDNCIVDWLIKEEGASGFNDKLELKIFAEKAKIDLASADVADIDCPFVKTTLSREQYKRMIQSYLDKICATIKNTVSASGRTLDDIDRYL